MADTLVCVAHPDDEAFGCGGTIAKWGDCHVVAFTNGVSSRPEADDAAIERRAAAFRQACGILGATGELLHYPDQRLDSYGILALAQRIEGVLVSGGAKRVLTHHLGDLNKDHRMVAEAVLVATRPPARYEVLTFETPSSTEWAFGMEPVFRPNVFVELTMEQLNKKATAGGFYVDELRKYPHPRNDLSLDGRARYWGQVSGCLYAEPLQLLRGYR